MDKIIIGCLEICNLPELAIQDLQIRIDTGAKTSSLHVDNIKPFKKDGLPWIKFDIHPDIHNVDSVVQCASPVHDIRKIKSSNGEAQQRFIIKTEIQFGSNNWEIEISLADRSDMSYLMLLGREGMSDRVLVDPSKRYLLRNEK